MQARAGWSARELPALCLALHSHHHSLLSLDLSHNPLGTKGCTCVAALLLENKLPLLRRLGLSGVVLPSQGTPPLWAALLAATAPLLREEEGEGEGERGELEVDLSHNYL
eukprot:1742588-Rhodomonas_salina.1